MFDIDRFKDINDKYGHLFGNIILKMVGEKSAQHNRRLWDCGSMGGDEFVGILSVEPNEAKKILERFMDSLKNEDKDECYRVTVSVGFFEVDGKLSMEQMIKKVDEAMYRSKEGGRNRMSNI